MSLVNATQRIISVRQHFEAIDEGGNFLCAGDTEKECFDELVQMIKEEHLRNAKHSA